LQLRPVGGGEHNQQPSTPSMTYSKPTCFINTFHYSLPVFLETTFADQDSLLIVLLTSSIIYLL